MAASTILLSDFEGSMVEDNLISNLFVDFVSNGSSTDYQNYYSKLLFVGDDGGRLYWKLLFL